MNRFICSIILLFLIKIVMFSNDVSAENNIESYNEVSNIYLNENNISLEAHEKSVSEDSITNSNTSISLGEDINNENIKNIPEGVNIDNNKPTKFNTNVTTNNEFSTYTSENQHRKTVNIDKENDDFILKNDIDSIPDEKSKLGKNKNKGNESNLPFGKNEDIQGNNLTINKHENDEAIVGQDDRKIVEDINKSPYKSIVSINTYIDESTYYSGTGFMIDDYAVLTAAHVVTSDNKDEDIKKIIVNAGYKERKPTIDIARVIKIYVMPEWINTQNRNYDMALLILDKPLGKKIGKLKIVDKSALNELNTTSGYPAKKNKNIRIGNQYFTSGKIVYITQNKLYYNLDTEGGQSGSPIFNTNNDVIAIHAAGFLNNSDYKFNIGVRLSSDKIKKIKQWNEELKFEKINKFITINKNDAKIWENLNFNQLSNTNKNLKGKIYKSINLYTDSNGGKYLLIIDRNNNFIGFIDIKSTTEIKGTSSNKVVQLKAQNVKVYRNFFDELKSDIKLSFYSHYKVKYIYKLPTNRLIYSLYDKNNKWQGYVNSIDVRENIFEPNDERIEIINNNYIVWKDFFGNKSLVTKSIYHKVFNAKGKYKDNNNQTYLKIYDSKNKFLGILNIKATKKVVHKTLNKNVKVISKNYNFYGYLFDTKRESSDKYINKKLFAKAQYKLSNGKTYYSLYDNKDNWIGYIENKAVKIL